MITVKTWYLLIMLSGMDGGVAIESASFISKDACIAAKQRVERRELKLRWADVAAVCVTNMP
jgi:hypothetical protein